MPREPRRSGELTVGLDPSPLRLGWAVTDRVTDEPIACGTEAVGRSVLGMHDAVAQVVAHVEKIYGHVVVVGVESPFVGPNRRGALAIAESMGQAAMGAALHWPMASIVRFAPSEWRKAVGPLNGRSSKDEVMLVARQYGFDPSTQDEADAAIIALAAAG